MTTSEIVIFHFLTVEYCILGAFRLYELVITSTSRPLAFFHFPLLKASHANVLSKQHVESSINVLKHAVTNEDNGVEAVQDHAYLRSGVPTIMTMSWVKRCIEAMASTTAHCFEKSSTVRAVGINLPTAFMPSWWAVQIC